MLQLVLVLLLLLLVREVLGNSGIHPRSVTGTNGMRVLQSELACSASYVSINYLWIVYSTVLVVPDSFIRCKRRLPSFFVKWVPQTTTSSGGRVLLHDLNK